MLEAMPQAFPLTGRRLQQGHDMIFWAAPVHLIEGHKVDTAGLEPIYHAFEEFWLDLQKPIRLESSPPGWPHMMEREYDPYPAGDRLQHPVHTGEIQRLETGPDYRFTQARHPNSPPGTLTPIMPIES